MAPRPTLLASALLALAAVACGGATTSTDSLAQWTVAVEPLQVPPGAGSVAPQLTVADERVILSWIDREDERSTLRFTERTGGGWSEPRNVAAGSDWFVSWADVPAVTRLSNGTLVANWFVTTREDIEAYDLYLSYSTDDGRTWSAPFMPHADDTETQHGFATLVELTDGGLGLVWLDGRDMHNNTTHPEGGVMMLRYTSFSPDWTQGADVVINEQVCECCQTAAVVTSDGVLAAFRDRSAEEIRDIAVSRLTGGAWTEAARVHADNWEIYGCPVNGPALSGAGRDVVVAWFTMKDDEGYAYAAFSDDAGRTWGAPIQLNEGASLGYVDVERLEDGSAVASWVEFAGDRRQVRLRRIAPSGDASPVVTVAGSGNGRVTGYPRMVRGGEELVFVWPESLPDEQGAQGAQQVKGAVARLPAE